MEKKHCEHDSTVISELKAVRSTTRPLRRRGELDKKKKNFMYRGEINDANDQKLLHQGAGKEVPSSLKG